MGTGAVRVALILAAVMAFAFAVPAAGSQPRAYGKELVAQYDLPADLLGRHGALGAAAADSTSGDTAAQPPSADSAMWVGPVQSVGPGRNPYTLVLTVRGVARGAGDSRSRWQTGWEVQESAVATREVLMSLNGIARDTASAGAPVTLTAVSAPVTFRSQRRVAPMLSLVHAHNLDITEVRLQVWSGSAPMAWPSLSVPSPAWLALGALCLFGGFLFTRQAHAPARAVAPELPLAMVSSLPPEPDLQRLLEHGPADATPAARAPTAPAAPRQIQALRVVAALHDVLTAGLAVPTELDNTRRRRGRRPAGQA